MRTPPTSPSKAAAPAELPRAKSAPQLRDRDSPDNVQQTPPPVPPIQELPPAVDAPRPPASPNSGEARRTLTAVLDALMGTADGQRRDRALRLENGSRVADYVRDHPDGAYTVRLFGDGFTIRREGDESIPKPPARKRPRRGGVHTSSSGVLVVLRLAPSTRRRRHSLPIYPRRVHDDADASPLQAYADHAAFLADVRDGRVPAAFRPDARPVRVRLEVEDYLPSAYRDVHAYLDPFRRAQNGEPPLQKPETLSSEGRSSRLKRFDKS